MRNALLAACLTLSSVITIGNTSATIPYPIIDAKYYAQAVFMILACLGVVLGLYALAYPSYFEQHTWMLPVLVYVWLSVSITSAVITQTLIPDKVALYVVDYVLIATLIGFATYALF